ncbi:portal protein [Gordonia phage Margaret]|nr:portal protein [Gordonia phage Margaret]
MKFETVIADLSQFGTSHSLTDAYYEGTARIPRLGINLPPMFKRIDTVVGWPATAIDVLHERIDWLGWDVDAKYKQLLMDAYDENQLNAESDMGHLDSLLYGMAYVAVTPGDEKSGEPQYLVSTLSAKECYGYWNRRTRRLDVAAMKGRNADGSYAGVLYEKDQTTFYERKTETSRWRQVDQRRHGLGRVPVVVLPNRRRAGRREGKSELTRAVRSYTNMAVRTLLGMEVNREFFSSPQRYALGAKEDAFTDENGNPIPGWQAILGSLWNIERDEELMERQPGSDGLPKVGEFTPNPPGPYINQLEGLAKMFSAEVGIPGTYLGFTTENPPSGDAIRALESRLIKRAERRIIGWDPAHREVAQIICALENNGEFPKMGDMTTIWRDPGTPTQAADADRAVKLVGGQILPATSQVALEMAGFSPSQIKRIERDRNKEAMLKILAQPEAGDPNAGGAQPNPRATADPGTARTANNPGTPAGVGQ